MSTRQTVLDTPSVPPSIAKEHILNTQTERIDAALDAALNMTFPASDPIAPYIADEPRSPNAQYEDFMTGFLIDNDNTWGRPAGVTVTQDGALLVSDDANGTIFRVTRK